MKKKIIAFTLILVCCVNFFHTSVSAAYEHERNLLTDKMEKENYKIYQDNIKAFAKGKTVTVKKTWPLKTASKKWRKYDNARLRAFDAYDMDHPELFFACIKVKNVWGRQNSTGKMVYSMDYYPQFSINWRPVEEGGQGRDAWKDYKYLMRKVDKIAAECRSAGSSRYDQLLYLHDWLIMNNAYNKPCYEAEKVGIELQDAMPHVAFSALHPDFSPVCDGYSYAFKLVCNALDIPCIVTPGIGFVKMPDGSIEAHRWNYVQMEDGKWYFVDVTWDDPIPSGDWNQVVSGHERHTYFLKGEEGIVAESHPTNLHEKNDYYPVVSKTDYDPAIKPAR